MILWVLLLIHDLDTCGLHTSLHVVMNQTKGLAVVEAAELRTCVPEAGI